MKFYCFKGERKIRYTKPKIFITRHTANMNVIKDISRIEGMEKEGKQHQNTTQRREANESTSVSHTNGG